MTIDPQLIAALHLEAVRRGALTDERAAGVAFQTSTLAALLDGAYDGDLTIGELRRHGDLGLGTFDALDGEMIVLDGEVWRAHADGTVTRAGDDERTPFAVVTRFDPVTTIELEHDLAHDELVALAQAHAAPGARMQAVRFDGRLVAVHARSIPPQPRPYRPLLEAARSQREFMLQQLDGTLVGFCFPRLAAGIELPGYHLHAIAADRSRGGHVLSSRVGPGVLQLAPLTDLHLELPPGIELPSPGSSADGDADALDRFENDRG